MILTTLAKIPWGGGYSTEVKSQKLISAKICLDFNFWGVGEGGEVFYGIQKSKNSKCQDLPKFEFSGAGGYSTELKSQKLLSAKICLNLNFQEEAKVKNF